MYYELIVIWDNGEKDIHSYVRERDAEMTAENMKMSFGNQIQWTGVREAREVFDL